MSKHKTAAKRAASKPVSASKARKAVAKSAASRTKSTKPKVESKKKMIESQKKPESAAAPAKAAVAKLVTVPPKAAKAPVKPAANANAKLAVVPPVAGKPAAVRPGAPVVAAPVAKPAIVAKEPEFSAGDYVVYPTHGVGRIQGVENQEIAGTSLKVIVITFEKERMTLRVPVGKATNSGLRRLSSRKEMETALKTLKGRSRIRRMMWSRRAQEYEAKINSGDPVSIAEVVRDLYRNAGQPDQSYSERQIYQAALDRLARELAAVEKIDEMAAAQKLESVLRAA
jgi:CarD family transcriptional regulator